MEKNAIYVVALPSFAPDLTPFRVLTLHWGVVWACDEIGGIVFTSEHVDRVWKPIETSWLMTNKNVHLRRPGTYLLMRIAIPDKIDVHTIHHIQLSLTDPDVYRNGTRSHVSCLVQHLQADGHINVDMEKFEQELDDTARTKINFYEDRFEKAAQPFSAISQHCW